MEAEAFLDTYFSIIENKTSWNTARMVEHPLLSLQKALCINRSESSICTDFQLHFHGLKPHQE